MAQFRVGMRVKRISGAHAAYWAVPTGAEGTITAGPYVGVLGSTLWDVQWDAYGEWSAVHDSIVPLTDPKAEAFLESIRQLKPLPVQEIA